MFASSLWGPLIYPPPSLSHSQLLSVFAGRRVVITGASSGIGAALARRLMSVGTNLILIARSEASLSALCEEAKHYGVEALYRVADLRDRKILLTLCEELASQFDYIDFLFCNAGKSIHRSLLHSLDRLHDFDRTMDLNFRSSVALSLALFPSLQKAHGKIIYTSAVSTLYPPAPGWAAYHASKEAGNVWFKTAAVEWLRLGVTVHIAYLPLVHTSMSMSNDLYRHLPAYTAEQAAGLLLRTSLGKRICYIPWWARVTVPWARMLRPVISFFYTRM